MYKYTFGDIVFELLARECVFGVAETAAEASPAASPGARAKAAAKAKGQEPMI